MQQKSSTQLEILGGSYGGNDATSHLKARRYESQALPCIKGLLSTTMSARCPNSLSWESILKHGYTLVPHKLQLERCS